MKIGIYIPNFGAFGDPKALLELAREADWLTGERGTFEEIRALVRKGPSGQ